MNRWFRLTPLLLVALVFFAAPAANAQMAKPEAKQPPHARVALYRIAPGKQLDFLKWMAEAEAIDKEAGVPASQVYEHTNGDSWDYMQVAPDLRNEQQSNVDEVAKQHGRQIRFPASLEFRTFVALHTDTSVHGPQTAAGLVAAAAR